MDISLIKRPYDWWPLFSGLVYSQTVGHTSLLGYQMKDLVIVLLKIPHNQLKVKWFGNGTCSKLGGFRHFSENGNISQELKITFLTTFFKALSFGDQ